MRLQKVIARKNRFFVPKPSNSLAIFHQNIAGILSKTNVFIVALEELRIGGQETDIICLSETFLKSGDEKNLHINNFILADFYSRPKKRRGGVCILCKSDLSYRKLPLMKDLAIANRKTLTQRTVLPVGTWPQS